MPGLMGLGSLLVGELRMLKWSLYLLSICLLLLPKEADSEPDGHSEGVVGFTTGCRFWTNSEQLT